MPNLSPITSVGLPGIDRIPFGMHACHFYGNREELLGALVPYFVAGLRGNERCLWVTAPPLQASEAYAALSGSGVDDAIQSSALVVLDFEQWYANSAGLKGNDVVELWLKEEERALSEGYSGLRIAGNMSFLRPGDLSPFIEYEHAVTARFKHRRIVALCSYMVAHCSDQHRSEVLQAHQWALQGTHDDWKWVARPECPQQATCTSDCRGSEGIAKPAGVSTQAASKAAHQGNRPTGSASKIRLLIAEDHPALRYTLHSILKQYPEFEIVGEATNGEDAVLQAGQLQPTVVLMDISMPKLDGIEATRRIKANFSRITVLGLSADAEGPSIKAMLKAGAVEVIPKEKATEDLYHAIRRVTAVSI